MAVNDFLVFDPNSGNLLSQADYAASGARQNGVSTGIASGPLYNKAGRQASIIAAMIAQFIVDNSGEDAIDDGTITTLLENFGFALGAFGRIKLEADLDVFVATTGDDVTNTGLTIGSPFATLQRAVDLVYNNYDMQGFGATIHVADGTYAAGAVANGRLVGGGSITIVGNTGTPANVVINVTNSNCLSISQSAVVTIDAMVLKATGSVSLGTGHGCLSQGSGLILVGAQMIFDDCQGYHMFAASGGVLGAKSGYTISGDAAANVASDAGGLLDCGSSTVELSGTPAFSVAFAVSGSCGSIRAASMTFTGTVATGSRYQANLNGVINTNGGGATYFPGDAGGTSPTGGQYA